MATRYGPYQSNARIEWDYSVGSVNQNTSSVTVTVRAYLRMQGSNSINGNWPVSWSGSWGSSSNTQNINLGGGQRALIRTYSATVTLTDSSQSRSYQIGVSHFWGSTSDTLNVTIPARYPNAPTNPQINLLSDDEIRVAWTRQGTYTSVGIQRQTDGGNWSGRGSALGNAGDWTDTWVDPNRRYRYRFQGRNSQGSSPWSAPTEYIYTRPAQVTGVTATRSGSGISVNATGLTPWATSYDIESDQDGIVGSQYARAALPFVHTDPNPAVPHRYRVRARVNSGGNSPSVLVGAWSAWSNTVQLIQQPNAPTNLSPNGTTSDESLAVRFSWRHNPVDSSAQEQYQLGYRYVGEVSWRTLMGTTAQTRDQVILDQFGSPGGPGEVEWQVRTRGAHPDYSPWSALATFTLVTAPTVAILEPQPIHRATSVTPEWNYAQEQNRPQSAWQVELRNIDTGELVEARSGSGNVSSVRLNARLAADTNYLVRVRAATGSIYSEWAEMPFVTEFVPPREPDVDAEWNDDAGSVDLTIEDADCSWDGILHQNLVTNPAMEATSGTVEVRRNEVANPQPTSTSLWYGAGANLTASTSIDGTNQLEVRHDGAGTSCYVRPSVAASSVEGTWMAFAVDVMPLSQWDADNMRLTMGTTSVASYSRPIPMGTFTRISVAHYIDVTGEALRPYVWPTNTTGFRMGFIVRRASVAIGDSEEAALAQVQDFFDGSTESPGNGLTASWEGTPHASSSVLTGAQVAHLGRPSPTWTNHPYQITEPDGSTAARFDVIGSSAIRIPISNTPSLSPGVTYTMMFDVRSERALSPVSPRIQNSLGAPNIDIPANEWTPVRLTAQAGSSTWANTGFYLNGSSGQLPGDFIDIRNAMLTEGEYDGPYHDGDDVGWSWAGTPHGSVSNELERPATETVTVERSVNDGETWEHVTEASFEDCSLSLSDFEGLSCGTTLYRVTNSAATGASIDVVVEVESSSEAIWLSTGEGFSQTVRLSLHDGIGIRRGRQRSLEQYQGRSLGVAYMSENLHRTISVQGMVPDEDRLRCPSATRDELDDVILAPYPVHLHRDMHGNRVYGIVPEVDNDREWLMRHEDCGEHQGMCRQGLWSFGYSLDETESR